MNIGDTVRDESGTAWQLTASYGRGTWSRSFGVKATDGTEGLLRMPLDAGDLGGDARLARACADIAGEQARLGREQSPPLAAHLATALVDGSKGTIMARRGAPWSEWVTGGHTTHDILQAGAALTRALMTLAPGLGVHGELTPETVWVDDRLGILLIDAATPSMRRHHSELHAAAGSSGRPWRAPELRGVSSPLPLSTASDTYAVGMLIYQALCAGNDRLPELPMDGLDKAARVALQDRITNRLQAEPANARFHGRLSERLTSTLNRALSRETSPSPPYRFGKLAELAERLDQLASMVHPRVVQAGRLIFDLKAGKEAFSSDEEVGFTCSVACSAGVDSHDEIACGIAVFDHDSGNRVREIQAGYAVDRHPSGRFRFRFRISELLPRAYIVRVAFTIRDSGDEPMTVEGDFSVRAAPGYVPPRPAPAPAPALTMEREPKTAVTEPGVSSAPKLVRPIDQGADRSRPSAAERRPSVAPVASPATSPGRDRPSSPGTPMPIRPAAAPAPSPAGRPSSAGGRASVIGVARPSSTTLPPRPKGQPLPRASARPAPLPKPKLPPTSISIQGEDERPSVVATTVDETRKPDPTSLPEPDFTGAGRWAPLPSPKVQPAELDDDDPPSRPSAQPEDGEQGPVGALFQRALELVRGDTYVLMVGVLGAAILVLALVLVMLRQGG